VTVGSSIGLGAIGQFVAKQNLLKRFCPVVVLNEEEGESLLFSDSTVIVEGVDGAYNPRNHAYLFVADGMHFYFECRKKVDVKNFARANNIFVPK
jgi:hypothetical protein